MNVTYDQIIGHDRQIQVLRSAIKSNRTAHAYLFAGPEGIGKRTTAISFAAALNCETNGDSACGECRSCRKIAEGNHPDIVFVEPDGRFIKIEQIRNLSRITDFAPYEGRMRMFVIEQAEAMNINAANALLKTLEEPSDRTMLVLISSTPQKLLPTILSRCQKITFKPLPPERIERYLINAAGQSTEKSRLLASLSGGSLGWALQSDLDEVLEQRRMILSELAGLNPADETAITAFAEKLQETGDNLPATLDLIKTFLRDAAIFAGNASPDRLINLDLADNAKNYGAQFTPGRLLNMGRSIAYAQRLLERNVNKGLVTMALALELVHPTGTGMDRERIPR